MVMETQTMTEFIFNIDGGGGGGGGAERGL